EAPYRPPLRRAGVRNRDAVDRLEERHDAPDGRQRVPVAVVKPVVVPTLMGVPVGAAGGTDPLVGERQEVVAGAMDGGGPERGRRGDQHTASGGRRGQRCKDPATERGRD